MPALCLLLGLLIFGGTWGRGAEAEEGDRRTQALSAFSRGDALSWDQLEVVAAEAGVSPEKIAQMKIKDRAERLIRQSHLPLAISGFSKGMRPEEEFRLYKGRRPGWGTLLLNADFWSKGMERYDNDPFLSYLLFRAEAYYQYRSHYDAEHWAWIVQEDSPAMQVLKAALDGSEAGWTIDDGPPTGRDLEFRRSLDPTQNPSRTLKALIEYALRAIAQKAADNWAEMRYRKQLGITSPVVTEQIRQRDRALAADFNRARMAMTRAERLAFRKVLKTSIRFSRTNGGPSSEPAYDPALSPR